MKTGWHIVHGLMGMDDGYLADQQHCELLIDMVWSPSGYWANTPGHKAISSFSDGREIDQLHWFAQHGGRRQRLLYLDRLSDTTAQLGYLTLPAAGKSSIGEVRRRVASGSYGVQFLDFNNWVYYIDGLNPPLCYNGHYERAIGFAGPAAPPEVAGRDEGYNQVDQSGFDSAVAPYISAWHLQQRGVGEIENNVETPWRYGYALSWINERGQESPISAVAFASGRNFVNTAGATEGDWKGLRLVRVGIPRAPSGVVAMRLYRTRNIHGVSAGTGFDMYLLDEFGSGGAVDYTDHTPDGELVTLLDQSDLGPWPAGARLVAYWQGRFFIAGMPEAPGIVRYSAPGFVEQMPERNRIPVGSPRAGAITALFPTPQALLVFRENGIYAIKATNNPVDPFGLTVLSSTIGAVGPGAVVEVPGQGVAFLNRVGPYLLVGAQEEEGNASDIRFIGQKVKRTWRRVNRDQLYLSRAAVHVEHKEVWFQVPEGGSIELSLGLAYHYELGGWSRRDDWPISDLAYRAGHMWFSSWDTSKEGIHVMSDGYATKAGTTVAAEIWTVPLHFEERAGIHSVQLYALAFGDATVNMQHRGNYADEWTSMSDNDVALLHPEHDRPLWNTATWSATEVFSDYEPTKIPLHFAANAHDHQLRMRGARLRIFGYELGLNPRGGPNAPRLKRDP